MAVTNKQKMKVKLFSVSSDHDKHGLEEVLELLAQMSLTDRNRTLVGGHTVRAEVVRPPESRKPYWLIDFVRLRFVHGPGRASTQRAVVGFEMSSGDGFAEETAMLYDHAHRTLFIQGNHAGVRESSAANYFGMIDSTEAYGFEFLPALDPSMAVKLAQADRFTKFSIKVAPGAIGTGLREANVGIGRALDVADEFDAPILEFTLSVGHRKAALPHKGRSGGHQVCPETYCEGAGRCSDGRGQRERLVQPGSNKRVDGSDRTQANVGIR